MIVVGQLVDFQRRLRWRESIIRGDTLVAERDALGRLRGPIVSKFWSKIDWTVLIK